jgi:DUF2075 family protein
VGFLTDASNGIEDVIRLNVKEKLNIDVKPGSGEYESWKNSLGNAMYHIINGSKIPEDSTIAVEYGIPRTKNRIDFIISGLDENYKEKIIIIELKQWSEIKLTDKDAMVETRFRKGLSEELHPSYQAWSYSKLLKGFNAEIYDNLIDVQPCAYLHNQVDKDVVNNDFYKNYLEEAPAFCKGDKIKLQEFIASHIKYGDKKDILYRVENGEIRPSKTLADSLLSMMKGNREFIMIDDQKVIFENALNIAKKSSYTNKNVIIIEGGPGTGKSVVAINLLVSSIKLRLNSQYVTKNSAPRAVFESKLTKTLKKTEISNLFTGSGSFAYSHMDSFDALIVDEAHRLNEKSGIYKNIGENQIKEIIYSSKCAIFFIDENQKVTWQDIGSKEEIEKWAKKYFAKIHHFKLESQFRCNGSDGFPALIDNMLQIKETANFKHEDMKYDFQIIDSPNKLREMILEKNKINNKARIVAGYCWNWVSKTTNNFDIEIPKYDFRMKWNLQSDGYTWIISPNSVNEVGCIHTCQGLEVDYVGVIIGTDLIVRNGEVITNPSNRAKTDKSIHGYKKDLKENPESAKKKVDEIIKNTYRTLMTRGLKGCYIYSVDEETNEYFKKFIS